jgi:zinc protease
MDIAYTKTTLANGLDVILHEDHTLPIVAVNVWYHVGSKDERPGLTGFAHLFEHLMFEGSANHDHGYFPPLQDAGAAVNGSTNADRTNYWEVVPTGALELALFLESDRMGFLLPALTEKKFTTQREVVINERRQNYENRPYGLAGIAMTTALYPADHPYHWPTIGYTPDLRQATLDDVRDFFARHYHPGNASIALAGDIDSAAALAQAEANFVYRLQTVGGFSGKSDQLNAYNIYRGNPGSFDADLARYTRLSAADVRDAARRLAAGPRVALSVVPNGAGDQALSGSVTAVAS